MTLPASPPITLAQVQAEFSAPSTATLTQFLRGGAYVPNTAQNAGVPTALPITLLNLLGAANTPAVAVNVTNHSVSGLQYPEPNDFPPPQVIWGTANARIVVNSSGALQAVESLNTGGTASRTYSGEWLAAGSAAGVDVRATIVSGTLSAGSDATDTWLNCGTTRSWQRNHAGIGGAVATITLDFCVAGTNGAQMLDSCTITLSASRT